jgi:hypothetical protein
VNFHAFPHVNLGDVPTWVAAVVALIALVAGVVAYRNQARQLRLQREQLGLQQRQIADQQQINAKQSDVLELQADELKQSMAERERIAAEQRREQAVGIFLSVPFRLAPPMIFFEAAVWNQSKLPIYDITANWFQDGVAWMPEGDQSIKKMMPGDRGNFTAGLDRRTSSLHEALVRCVVVFRDAAGVRWRVDVDGHLREFAGTLSEVTAA